MAEVQTALPVNPPQLAYELGEVSLSTLGPDQLGITTVRTDAVSQSVLTTAVATHVADPGWTHPNPPPIPPPPILGTTEQIACPGDVLLQDRLEGIDTAIPAAILTHEGTPHGGSHPDLATHNTLGLATQAELDAVAAAKADTGHTHQGGSETWTTVKATSDVSHNNSNVVTDDGTLQVTLLANTQYSLYIIAFFLTNATADLKYRMVFTGTTTRVRRKVSRTATTDVAVTTELKTAFDAADVILSTTGLNPWLEEDIIIQVGASGGVLKLQWGQGTSNAGPTTRLGGSYLMHTTS